MCLRKSRPGAHLQRCLRGDEAGMVVAKYMLVARGVLEGAERDRC